MSAYRCVLAAILGAALAARPGAQTAKPLDVYFIDVEGGQATLVVTPSGHSMLIDTGYPGFENRDANRILSVAKQAGLTRLDYLLITHYHNDHVGNAPTLASRIPIDTFVDHGETVETDDNAKALYASYLEARANNKHLQVTPGETIQMRDADVTIVTAGGAHVAQPLSSPAAPNPLCAAFTPKAPDASENARSVGSVISFGRFRMVDLGDLTWNKEQELACPGNLIGTVDVYLTTHHGLDQSGAPVLVHALRPRVAIMNNGPKKGGSAEAIRTVRSSPGLEDFWQLHYAVDAGKGVNMPDAMIANLDESTAHFLKLSAQRDGSFTVTNGRTNQTRRYPARPAAR
jgi:beta-lactamase superfamily II metal-dependent hydrolase